MAHRTAVDSEAHGRKGYPGSGAAAAHAVSSVVIPSWQEQFHLMKSNVAVSGKLRVSGPHVSQTGPEWPCALGRHTDLIRPWEVGTQESFLRPGHINQPSPKNKVAHFPEPKCYGGKEILAVGGSRIFPYHGIHSWSAF